MQNRPEHPKPQFKRKNWVNLNGEWEFEIDNGNSGEARGLLVDGVSFSDMITVPFCPQSKLSGINNTDFMTSVWYRRKIEISEEALSGRIFLHFGAVDYRATVFINGKKVGTHDGGFVSFSMDITDFVHIGENILVVQAEDDERNPLIPTGKQSETYHSQGCFYTRTTGIWQTVWLEFMPTAHIRRVKYYPDVATCSLVIWAELAGIGEFSAKASFDGNNMGEISIPNASGQITVIIPLKELHLWEISHGRLYDLQLSFEDDKVESYFGMRSISYDDRRFRLNGKTVFQRLILDQGFYPDGIYTAPSDKALSDDIALSMAMGFNGARPHQKIFEERYLYHCDRAGYLVWGEFPSWGLDHSRPDAVYSILPEWLEEIERDFNHPALVGWCPFNETWDVGGRKQYDPLLALVYKATKSADPTRPCIDSSGVFHVITDVYDVHCYDQEPEIFAARYARLSEDIVDDPGGQWRQHYDGKSPFFVSEYGGIAWNEDSSGWGYGNTPESAEAFLARLKGLTDALLDNPLISGFCYTQLTDVEQEQNGLYTYDRKAKFDPSVIYPIFSKTAAIEKTESE